MSLESFTRVGRALFLRGLVGSHSGNLSLRRGDRLVITRHGAMLGHLCAKDLVELPLHTPGLLEAQASVELPVHRALYEHLNVAAVIHAHPPHAIALSLLEEVIQPQDQEGAFLLGAIPVIAGKLIVASGEIVPRIVEGLAQHKLVIARGHGSYAVGRSLEEAWQWTSVLEESCQVLLLLRKTGPSRATVD